MKFNPVKEAEAYAHTVTVFFPKAKKVDQIRMAFLSGVELAKRKYGIKDDIFEGEMASQPTLFEWAGYDQNFSGRSLGAKTARGFSRH